MTITSHVGVGVPALPDPTSRAAPPCRSPASWEVAALKIGVR